MGGQEGIMGILSGSASPVVTGCTLVGLGSVALLLFWAEAKSPGAGSFIVLLGSPLAGFAAAAIGFRRHWFSLVVPAASGVYVVPLVWLTLFATTGDTGCGFALLFWAGLAWVFIAILGFAGWRSLESERIRFLFELWLARPPERRSSVDVGAFYDELERDRPELLRWRGGDKYDELRADLELDQADQRGVDQQRSLLR
jgi:hypothetical protein